jgi:hypothetical protein
MKISALHIMLVMLLTIITANVYSQMLYSSDTDLSILSGTTITVIGSVTTNGTTTIANGGTMTATGDWINNSNNDCFGISQGTFVLDGATQLIAGSSETVFNNLNLLGTGTKTLNTNATVGGGNLVPTGVLDLGIRHLDLNTHILTVTTSSPSAITRSTGYIISETDPTSGYGTVLWETGNISGGSNYIFPFGNLGSGHYIPLSLNFTAGSSGSPGTISASTYPTNTALNPNNRPLPTGLSVLTSFAGTENAANTLDRFWIVDVSGYNSTLTADVSFTYRDTEWNTGTNTITESTLRAQRHDLLVWSPPSGTINTTSNILTVSGVNDFNTIWALAGNTSPLPIELLSFTAEPVDNSQIICKWVTVSEINNDYFTVERSVDGYTFEDVGIIDGAGNSTVVLEYDFTDKYTYRGTSYCRLKQTDFDGSNYWSKIVAVTLQNISSGGVTVYPNPSAGIFYVNSLGVDHQIKRLIIFDITGRAVMDMQEINSNSSLLDMTEFANGVYTITVYANDQRKTIKVIKQ